MRIFLAPLALLALLDSQPRVEVRGVEISGVWLGLTERSHVAVYYRGPDGVRLLSPDSAASWTALDSGSVSIQLPSLPAAAMTPVNCVVTDRDVYRWDPLARATVRISPDDCGPLPPTNTGPGRTIPGRPGQTPGDPRYLPRQIDTADRERYVIVIAMDADSRPRDPAKVVDDWMRQMPPLALARELAERLGGLYWTAVVVRLK